MVPSVRDEDVAERVYRHAERPQKSPDHVGPAEHIGRSSVRQERLNTVVERVGDNHATVDRVKRDRMRKVETPSRGPEAAKGARRKRLIRAIEYLDAMVVGVGNENVARGRIDGHVVRVFELTRELVEKGTRVAVR